MSSRAAASSGSNGTGVVTITPLSAATLLVTAVPHRGRRAHGHRPLGTAGQLEESLAGGGVQRLQAGAEVRGVRDGGRVPAGLESADQPEGRTVIDNPRRPRGPVGEAVA